MSPVQTDLREGGRAHGKRGICTGGPEASSRPTRLACRAHRAPPRAHTR